MFLYVPVRFRRIQLYLWGGPSSSSQTSLNRDSKPEWKKVHITEQKKSWKLTMLNEQEDKKSHWQDQSDKSNAPKKEWIDSKDGTILKNKKRIWH